MLTPESLKRAELAYAQAMQEDAAAAAFSRLAQNFAERNPGNALVSEILENWETRSVQAFGQFKAQMAQSAAPAPKPKF